MVRPTEVRSTRPGLAGHAIVASRLQYRHAPYHAARRPGDAPSSTLAVRTAIVILNWNNGPATIRCLDAVDQMTRSDVRTYVVDNGSTDGAQALIRQHLARTGRNVIEWTFAARTGCLDRTSDSGPLGTSAEVDFVIIDRNLGYGGGNNVGIALAMNDGADAVWILNNDARPHPEAFNQVLAMAASRPDIGMVGSTILLDDGSDRVQSVGGGRYHWLFGRSQLIGAGATGASVPGSTVPEPDYIDGAAILLTRPMIRDIGAFEEGFHLYCEEIELAERARRRGWRLAVARSAVVHHEFGGTAGSSLVARSRTRQSYFYASRAAIMLSRRHNRFALPIVALARCAFAASLAVRGLRSAATAVLRGTVAGFTAPLLGDRSYRAVVLGDAPAA